MSEFVIFNSGLVQLMDRQKLRPTIRLIHFSGKNAEHWSVELNLIQLNSFGLENKFLLAVLGPLLHSSVVYHKLF